MEAPTMRSLTTILVFGYVLLSAMSHAEAATPGFVCRNACGPRILEQCGAVDGGAPRRCRRALIRACKVATPEAACQTTVDLTRSLVERRLTLADDAEI